MLFSFKKHSSTICIWILLLACFGCSDKVIEGGKIYYSYKNKQNFTNAEKDAPIETPVMVRSGKDVRLEISDFNPLKQEINVNDSSSRLFLTDTAKLSKMLVAGMTGIPTAKTIQKDTVQSDDPGVKREVCAAFEESKKGFSGLITKLNTNMEHFREILPIIDLIKSSHQNLLLEDALTSAKVKTELEENFITPLNNYLNKINSSNVNNDAGKVSSLDIENKVNNLYIKIDAQVIIDFEQTIRKPDPKAKCFEAYKDLLKKTELGKTEIKAFQTQYKEKVYPELKKILSLYNAMQYIIRNEPVFISKAISIVDDEHFFKINVKSTGQANFSNYDVIKILPYGGIKIDVSAGFFVSGLHDEMHIRKSKDSIITKSYLSNGKLRDTTILQAYNGFFKQDQIPVSFGGSIYLHVHSQYGGYWNWGGSLGFGALFNDQARLVFSAGPTLLLGKKQRFTINPGVSLGQVDRLSSSYKTGEWYDRVIDNVPTYKAWDVSWSLGLSWNL